MSVGVYQNRHTRVSGFDTVPTPDLLTAQGASPKIVPRVSPAESGRPIVDTVVLGGLPGRRATTMTMQRILVGALAVGMLVATAPAMAQQAATGVITGQATKEVAPADYDDHRIQLRNAQTGQVLATTGLDAQGNYRFDNVVAGLPHVVELVNVQESRIVCAEGPLTLSAQGLSRHVPISCGGSAAWLLLAAAGLPGLIGTPTSADR